MQSFNVSFNQLLVRTRYQAGDSPLRAFRTVPTVLRKAMTAKPDKYDDRWYNAWKRGLPPGQGWDISRVAPAFTDFLESTSVDGKTAFVPGCGRGYDVVELARRGATAVGLDLSPEAVVEAKKYRDSQNLGAAATSATFNSGDFFMFRADEQWVDLGYDFTFLCALHPSLRQKWAEQWSTILRPGAKLVTLVFPINKDASLEGSGPPWPVNEQLYADLLCPLGFEKEYEERVQPNKESHPGMGKETLICWRKKLRI